jgi:hypothetical protein
MLIVCRQSKKTFFYHGRGGVLRFCLAAIVITGVAITACKESQVDAQIPSIKTQPAGADVTVGESYKSSVAASVTDGGSLSYQWYSNTNASNAGGSAITNAESASYNPSTDTAGTYYYFVEITNTIPNNGDGGNKTATVRSKAAEIRVLSSSPSGIVIDLAGMNEWELTEQTAQVNAYENKVFTVTGTYTTYQWYLNGVSVGTSSSYTFNRPVGIYELVVVVTNSNEESRSGRCRITVDLEISPQLTNNEWFNGDLTMATSEHRYLIPVTSGTIYHIWWNDRFKGNGSKTGDVVVGARYIDSSTWIFGGTDDTVDSGWDTVQSFTANQTGVVEIRVIPYSRDSLYIGTYGIAYSSTGSTRPEVQ